MKKGVIAVFSALGGAMLGVMGVRKSLNDKIAYNAKMSVKHLSLYLMMNKWVKAKQANKSIAEYLAKQGYKEIAIYGMNYVGETLWNELVDSDIYVQYGIDKNADSIYLALEVLHPDDELPQVDAVIVTAITFYDEIADSLLEKLDCPILSLEDVLDEI